MFQNNTKNKNVYDRKNTRKLCSYTHCCSSQRVDHSVDERDAMTDCQKQHGQPLSKHGAPFQRQHETIAVTHTIQ